MNETARLLGFDAREVSPRVEAAWSSARRAEFTLATSQLPLSVDEVVWPSAFTHARHGNEGWIARPEWIGPDNLWSDLAALEAAIARSPAGGDDRGFWKLAVTWHRENSSELRGPGGPYAAPTSPADLDPSWTFLGFDVADPSTSGLLNCGYGVQREALRRTWGPRLNAHHLLQELDDAFAFRRLTAARVTEHARFFVLGLWRVP